MSTAVGFATGTGLMSREDLVKGLNNVANSIPAVGGDFQFLKMDKGTGEWCYGAQETVTSPKAQWAINPLSIQHGWVCWDSDAGGPPIEEIMVGFISSMPDKNSLPRIGNGAKGKPLAYQKQFSFQLLCIADPDGDGEDTDFNVAAEYKQSSVGAAKAFKVIVDKLRDRANKGEEAIVPVVRLSNDRYKHDTYGWIQNPIFDIVEWRTMNGEAATKADAAQDEPDEDDEAAALAVEYEAAKAAEAPAEDTPRRRTRR